MKILINASTITYGGGIQVSLNLIETFRRDPNLVLEILVSKNLFAQLDEVTKKRVILIEETPAKILAWKSRKKIRLIANRFDPDIIYSIGAPSYIRFKQKEVLRLTNPYIIDIRSSYLVNSKLINRVQIYLKTHLQRLFINKNQFIITQTELAKKRIHDNLKIELDKIKVIHNSLSLHIKGRKIHESISHVVLSISYPYPHKNFRIIPEVAFELKKMGYDHLKMIVTLSDKSNSETRLFKVKLLNYDVQNMIEIIDNIPHKEVSEFYSRGSIVFVPSICEVFSATVVEAMYLKKKILVADEDFNREMFGSHVSYFDSNNAKDAALKIIELYHLDKPKDYSKFNHLFQKEKNYNQHLQTLIKWVENYN